MSDWLEQFLSPDNFEAAWQKIYRKHSGAGVDGETVDRLADRIDDVLPRLLKSVADGAYRPLPLKPLFIPKNQTEWRHLAFPTVRDRLVQQALLQVLHRILEPQFEPCSFAYRPGKSYLTAVQQVRFWHRQGFEWVLEADLVKYFEQLNQDRLLAEVIERVNEPLFVTLIERWVKTGILTESGLILPKQGLAQGSVISPILSNVYLDDFDEAFLRDQVKLVRFADDFLILSRSEKMLIKAKAQVEQLLDTMGLTLNPDKTQITTFAKGFKFLGHTFVGDLLIENKPRSRRIPKQPKPEFPNLEKIVHTDPSDQSTVMAQALLKAVQQHQEAIPAPLYVVLGYKPREKTTVAIESNEIIWLPTMPTLYLVNQGTTVRKQQGRLLIEQPQKDNLELPLSEINRILVFGNIQLTTPVLTLCLEEKIPVIYLTQFGQYKGHLWSDEAFDFTLELAQFQRSQEDSFQRNTACAVVQGKLWNSRQLLLRLNRDRHLPMVGDAVQKLADYRDKLSADLTVDQIRGYEGTGAACYFEALGQLIIHPDFKFKDRTFHPPLDPVNAMLSYGYTLLFSNVFSLVLAEGLNPHLGNLHHAERPKAYLPFDLMEEFRSPVVDTLVLQLINQRVMKPTDFTWPKNDGAVYLNEAARRVFLKHFEARIVQKTSHPDLKEQVSYRRAIHLQIQRYAKSVLGRTLYEPFRRQS